MTTPRATKSPGKRIRKAAGSDRATKASGVKIRRYVPQAARRRAAKA